MNARALLSAALLVASVAGSIEYRSAAGYGISWQYAATVNITAGGPYGPADWSHVSSYCAVTSPRQSPSLLRNSGFNVSAPALRFNYEPVEGHLHNTGPAVEFAPGNATNSFVTDSGVQYTLYGMHFHWSAKAGDRGSEHAIFVQDSAAIAELHFVHYRSDFDNMTEAQASGEGDALAVIGVLFYADATADLAALKPITDNLTQIANHSAEVSLEMEFDPITLLPAEKSYFHYMGSLTTPPCSPLVSWFVMNSPLHMSSSQIAKFRTVDHGVLEDGTPIDSGVSTIRPLQPVLTNTYVDVANTCGSRPALSL